MTMNEYMLSQLSYPCKQDYAVMDNASIVTSRLKLR